MRLSLTERRKVPRIPFDAEMKFKVLKGNGVTNYDELENGRIKNISEYGIGVIINKFLEEEDIIRIIFSIGEKEFNIFSEVIWCKEIAFSGIYEAGLEFSYIKDEDYDFLCSAVKMLKNVGQKK